MNRIIGVEETRSAVEACGVIAVLMTVSQAAILIVVLARHHRSGRDPRWLGLRRAAAVLATALHAIAVFIMILLSFAVAMYFGPTATPAMGMDLARQPPGCHRPGRGQLPLPHLCAELGQLQRDVWVTRRHRGAHELALAVQHRAAGRGGSEQGHRGRLAPGQALRREARVLRRPPSVAALAVDQAGLGVAGSGHVARARREMEHAIRPPGWFRELAPMFAFYQSSCENPSGQGMWP